jgi:hypothetical protein
MALPNHQPVRILAVVTSHAKLGATDRSTGFWMEELAAPYNLFGDHGDHCVAPRRKRARR